MVSVEAVRSRLARRTKRSGWPMCSGCWAIRPAPVAVGAFGGGGLCVCDLAEVVGVTETSGVARPQVAVDGGDRAQPAIQLASRGTDREQRTFGLYRLEILAALANAMLLFGVAVYVLVEAVRRFGDPPECSLSRCWWSRCWAWRRTWSGSDCCARGLQGIAQLHQVTRRGVRLIATCGHDTRGLSLLADRGLAERRVLEMPPMSGGRSIEYSVTLSDGRQRPILPVAGSHVRGGRGKPLDHALAHLPAAVDHLAAALTNAGLRTDGPLPAPGLWRLLRSRIYPADDATRRAASGASLAERLGLVGAGRWVGSTRASSRAGCGPPRRSPTSLRRSRSTGSCRVLSPVRCRRRHLSRRGSAVSRSSTTASGNCGSGTGRAMPRTRSPSGGRSTGSDGGRSPHALEVEGRETPGRP